jgi:hypothetical protein
VNLPPTPGAPSHRKKLTPKKRPTPAPQPPPPKKESTSASIDETLNQVVKGYRDPVPGNVPTPPPPAIALKKSVPAKPENYFQGLGSPPVHTPVFSPKPSGVPPIMINQGQGKLIF